MSSLTEVSANLQAQGPIIEVTLGVTTAAQRVLEQANLPIPPRVTAQALIDTGASHSAVQQGLPGQLGLNPVGIQMVGTASDTSVLCAQYALSFMFPNGEVDNYVVTETAALAAQGLDCLLGRDVLADAVFVYLGPQQQFTLCF